MSKSQFKRIIVGIVVLLTFICVVCFSGNNEIKKAVFKTEDPDKNISVSSMKFNMEEEKSATNYETDSKFNEELFSIDEICGKDIKVNSDKKVVGFSLNEDPETSMDTIKNILMKKDWLYVESKNKNVASFKKNSGSYSWAYVNCNKVLNETEVVIVVD